MAEATFLVGASALVVVLLGCSAFFSSSETAIFAGIGAREEDDPRPGDRRAAALAELREDPHRLLVTLLVGNNVVNVALSSVVTVVLIESLPTGVAVTAATLLASSLVLVFGEIVPKSYGLGNADRWSLAVAVPLRVVELALLPAVVVFDLTTRRLAGLLDGDADIEEHLLDG